MRHLRQFGYGKRSPSLEQNLVDEMKDLIEFLRHEKSHPKYHDGLAMVPSIFAWGKFFIYMYVL